MDRSDATGQALASLRREAAGCHAWSNGPGDRYAEHVHAYHKVLVCTAGSIRFRLEGREVELGPGERLEILPGTPHSATAGPAGCTCVEGRL